MTTRAPVPGQVRRALLTVHEPIICNVCWPQNNGGYRVAIRQWQAAPLLTNILQVSNLVCMAEASSGDGTQ